MRTRRRHQDTTARTAIFSCLRSGLLILGCGVAVAAAAASRETVVQVQVQGNTITSDAEMLDLAGIAVGRPLADDTLEDAAARLKATGRFDRVEVLKRFASIADPSQIVVVIVVHEPGASIEVPGAGLPARVVRRRSPGLQYLPLLDFDDGYGWTYGLQLARRNVAGRDSRLAFPLTWGGERKAGAVLDRAFQAGPLTRVEGGGLITRRMHPFYGDPENRRRVWIRAERQFGPAVRAGTTIDWQHVSLGAADDDVPSFGGDVTLDTRVDPWLARNAVWARAAWRRATFPQGAVAITEIDARGYVGLLGQSVLVVRALHDDASAALPVYARPMLGGTDNLRGFRAGTAVGDTLAAASAEVRVPLNSPLRVAKLGVNAFVDLAAVYPEGGRMGNQPFKQGVGGGVWFSLAFLRVSVVVAHGLGGSTRVHFGTNVGI